MNPIVSRLADCVEPETERLDAVGHGIAPALCDDRADLARWIAIPVGLSVLLWGGLLRVMFT